MQIEIDPKKIKMMIKNPYAEFVFSNKKIGKEVKKIATGQAILTIDLNDYLDVIKSLMSDQEYREYLEMRQDYITNKNKRKRSARMGWETRKYARKLLNKNE